MNETVHLVVPRSPSRPASAKTVPATMAKRKSVRETSRTNDPARTMAGILEVATT